VISLQRLNLSLTPIELSHYQVEAARQVSDAEIAWNEHCRCVEDSTDLDELKGSPADLLTGYLSPFWTYIDWEPGHEQTISTAGIRMLRIKARARGDADADAVLILMAIF